MKNIKKKALMRLYSIKIDKDILIYQKYFVEKNIIMGEVDIN